MLAAADRIPLPKDAVGLHKNLTGRASLDLRVPTLVASTSGYRTLGDLGNTSEVQADERTIPDITDWMCLLVMGNRLREPSIRRSRRQQRLVDRKRKRSVEDETLPLPSEEPSAWNPSFPTDTSGASLRTKMQARQW